MGYWHHCGPSCDWPPPTDWYEWYGLHRWRPSREPDEEWGPEPRRWRRRRGSRRERDEAMRLETLESRARDLREELERIESDIERLTPRPDEDSGS